MHYGWYNQRAQGNSIIAHGTHLRHPRTTINTPQTTSTWNVPTTTFIRISVHIHSLQRIKTHSHGKALWEHLPTRYEATMCSTLYTPLGNADVPDYHDPFLCSIYASLLARPYWRYWTMSRATINLWLSIWSSHALYLLMH